MRLVESDLPKIYKKCKWQKPLYDFINSDMQCAEIVFDDDEKYANIAVANHTVIQAIKNHKIAGVKCRRRDGRLYLVKEYE